MKILKVGDKSKAVCHDCKSLVPTTFMLKDVPFSDGRGTAKQVLAGICDQCERVVSIPHQSTPAIKKAFEAKRKPVEVRLPAHMVDILNMAAYEIGAGSDFVPNLVKFYIHNLSKNKVKAAKISTFLDSELATGSAQKRLSLKGRVLDEDIATLKNLSAIQNTTDLLKSVILKINEDLLVKKRKEPISQLKSILAAVA